MAARIDLTFDCADAARLAEFWKVALGYEDVPPPAPFASREEWLRDLGEPGYDPSDGAWLQDPGGVGPRLCLLKVPEPKVAKNGCTWTSGYRRPAAPANDGRKSLRRSTG
jgi:hypothetical protein